jgi:spermidine synthase
MFLRKTSNDYDCIVLDAFTIGGRIPFHLVTRECLELCRERMTPDGVFVVNFGSALEGERSRIFRSMYRTTTVVFPNVYVFAREYREAGLNRTTNIILVATKATAQIAESQWRIRAEQYPANEFMAPPRMIQMAADQVTVTAPDPSAPIFTDDFAAIETMPD